MKNVTTQIRIDSDAAAPLATQVSEQLAWLIVSGELAPGDELPAARTLASQLGINLHTVRAAYQQLTTDGLVSTHRGRRATVLAYDRTKVATAAPDVPSFTIGVIIPGFAPFYAPMLDGIESAAAEHPSLVFICNAHDDRDAVLGYMDRLIARRVDGIIVTFPAPLSGDALPAPGFGPPIVYVDYPGAPRPGVEFDLERAGFEATSHLIEHGHTRIAYLTPPTEWPNVAPKLDGYQRALRSVDLTPESQLVAMVADFTIESGHKGAIRLIDRPDSPTAIVAASDALALGAIDAVASRGLRVPEDVAVVGNDDTEIAALIRPSLTTVALPSREAGIHAVTMLQQLTAGLVPEPSRLVLDVRLVARRSCGCGHDAADEAIETRR
jgi:DNA-binding LacI/PurR family transcriptional regulator